MAAITRRTFMDSAAVITGSLSLGTSCGKADNRPNILLIIVDQMSGRVTDFSGTNSLVRTPAMDALAASGVSFANAYCPYPLCSPSRSAMFTGHYVHETGVALNSNNDIYNKALPRLGDLFQDAGYLTAYFGKDHSGGTAQPAFEVSGDAVKGKSVVTDPVWSRQCVEFLQSTTNRPFLAVASLHNPHDICGWIGDHNEPQQWPDTNNLPPSLPNLRFNPATEPEYRTIARTGWGENFRTEQASDWEPDQFRAYLFAYYRFVEMVDSEIGVILEALKQCGKEDNTVVLFISDHGDGMGAHHLVTKPHMTEETIRVPMIIRWPGHIETGVTDEQRLVSGIDILPTLCECAGIPIPGSVRGRSLCPVLTGAEEDWRDYVVTQESGGRTLRTGDYKYVRYAYGDRPEALYNLRTDPGEMGNLIDDAVAASMLDECRTRLNIWMAETGDAFTLTNVPQRNQSPPL
jgi:arylsulfatase A-like enzyme